GAFVSSILNLWTLPLFLLIGSPPPRPSPPALQGRVRLVAWGAAGACVATTLFGIVVLGYRTLDGVQPTVFALFPLSLLAIAVYLALACQPLAAWQPLVEPRRLRAMISTPGLWAWVLINVTVKAVCEWLQRGGSLETSAGVMGFAFGGGNSLFVRGTVAPLI